MRSNFGEEGNLGIQGLFPVGRENYVNKTMKKYFKILYLLKRK